LALSGHRAATAAGVAFGTAVGYNIANIGPAADVLAEAYGVRLGAVGLLTTALFVTHLVMQIPGGKLVDRRGARVLIAVALSVIACGNAIALIDPSFPLGIVARLIVGLGTGVGFVAGSDYVRATVGSTTAQGLYGAAGVGGGGLAIAIVPLTTAALDWRAPYLTALVFAGVVLACLPFTPREPERRVQTTSTTRPKTAEIVRDRRLHPLAVAHSASSASASSSATGPSRCWSTTATATASLARCRP
jgi:MFS family permease